MTTQQKKTILYRLTDEDVPSTASREFFKPRTAEAKAEERTTEAPPPVVVPDSPAIAAESAAAGIIPSTNEY